LLLRLCLVEVWIFSWAMSHICAYGECRSQLRATNQPENILSRQIESSRHFRYSFTDFLLVYRCALMQIFTRSQPMRESNSSTKVNIRQIPLCFFIIL
jgi:hypothetical protein